MTKDLVYLFKSGKWRLYQRKGKCVQCGSCCETLGTRETFIIAESSTDDPKTKGSRIDDNKKEENCVLINVLVEPHPYIIIPGRGKYDWRDIWEIVRKNAAHPPEETVIKIHEVFPKLVELDNDAEEELRFILMGAGSRIVVGHTEYSLVSNEEADELQKDILEENEFVMIEGKRKLVRQMLKIYWDSLFGIGCSWWCAPDAEGKKKCLEYAEAIEYNDKGREGMIPMTEGRNRPLLCQISPVHPDEINGYDCKGFTFVEVQ